MPTTTANYADIILVPSNYLLTALACLYVSAALLLLFSVFYQVVPLPLALGGMWLLCHEYWRLAVSYCRAQGRMVIEPQGDIRWQGDMWRLDQAKIRTRWVLLMRLTNKDTHQWMIVSPDSCDQSAYRSLALYCHHSASICHE
ncbi:protein YgfX [Photobacterium minamisatsumaniensis]|uniref:protein YgfX n=1 Tax=Photobacterium minamisatsumaniensis TaxID=2910233 RepID=UPI003D14806C